MVLNSLFLWSWLLLNLLWEIFQRYYEFILNFGFSALWWTVTGLSRFKKKTSDLLPPQLSDGTLLALLIDVSGHLHSCCPPGHHLSRLQEQRRAGWDKASKLWFQDRLSKLEFSHVWCPNQILVLFWSFLFCPSSLHQTEHCLRGLHAVSCLHVHDTYLHASVSVSLTLFSFNQIHPIQSHPSM